MAQVIASSWGMLVPVERLRPNPAFERTPICAAVPSRRFHGAAQLDR